MQILQSLNPFDLERLEDENIRSITGKCVPSDAWARKVGFRFTLSLSGTFSKVYHNFFKIKFLGAVNASTLG